MAIGDKYILNGQTPIKTDSILGWLDWLDTCGAEGIVATANIAGYRVHTRFTALDYSDTDVPTLFITEVMGPTARPHVHRSYPTWADAEFGHNDMVRLVERAVAENDTIQSIMAKEEAHGLSTRS